MVFVRVQTIDGVAFLVELKNFRKFYFLHASRHVLRLESSSFITTLYILIWNRYVIYCIIIHQASFKNSFKINLKKTQLSI